MEHDGHYEITTKIPVIKKEDIKAALEDGVLKLTAPKVAEEVPQQRQVDTQ